MALATTVRGKLFTETERENGKAAWVLGASFISEGAIPFAAADPLRVIPSSMVGGAVTGALSMAFGAHAARPARRHLRGPADRQAVPLPDRHRGGPVVSAGLVVVLKGMRKKAEADATAPAGGDASAKGAAGDEEKVAVAV